MSHEPYTASIDAEQLANKLTKHLYPNLYGRNTCAETGRKLDLRDAALLMGCRGLLLEALREHAANKS